MQQSDARVSKGATRNKRAAAEPDAAPAASLGQALKASRVGPRSSSMVTDDDEVDAKFREAVDKFLEMKPETDDDAGFTAWCKSRVTSMSELKTQISNKKKSLKRRSTKTDTDLGSRLDIHLEVLNKLMDFVRKLSVGHSEGQQLYTGLVEMPDLEVNTIIWKRALRAVAFETLKLAQWGNFFNETFELCRRHLPDDEEFFPLLASQLLQRLLKALPVSKLTNESLNYVRSFVDAAIVKPTTTQPVMWNLDDHINVLNHIHEILDLSAAPSAVAAALEKVSSDEAGGHWAAAAFTLPQGRKVLDFASATAKAKDAKSEILEILHSTERELTSSGLCNLEAPFLVALKGNFDGNHAALLAKAFQDLAQKKLKILKNGDRDKLNRVQDLSHQAVLVAILAHVNHELIPFLTQWSDVVKTADDDVVIDYESRCVGSLADGVCPITDLLKDVAKFLGDLKGKFFGPAIDPKEIGVLSATWKLKSKVLLEALSAAVSKAGADSDQRVPELIEKLKECVMTVGATIDHAIHTEVDESTSKLVEKCLHTLQVVSTTGKIDQNQEHAKALEEFGQMVEEGQLMSTGLSDEGNGKVVRDGLKLVLLLVRAMTADTCLKTSTAESAETFSRELIASVHEVNSECTNIMALLSDLDAKVSALTPDDHKKIESVWITVSGSAEERMKSMAEDCESRLKAALIPESEVEIPESVDKIESYHDITAELVKDTFRIETIKELSDKTVQLGDAITHARTVSTSLGMEVGKLVEIATSESSYRSAIRWMATGNVLYALLSKAIARAVQTRSKPSAKALSSLQDSLKIASENSVELPASLQAVITKVSSGEEMSLRGQQQTD